MELIDINELIKATTKAFTAWRDYDTEKAVKLRSAKEQLL
jgi:hypothetical protein